MIAPGSCVAALAAIALALPGAASGQTAPGPIPFEQVETELPIADDAPTPQADWPKVRIGVRVDAMPFAWRELRPRREDNIPQPGDHLVFRGVLVDLCTRAALHAGFSPELVPVDATQRSRFLERLALKPDDNTRNGNDDWPPFQLLCDPTTVSLSRMYRIEESEDFLFSPIVFVANSSYVQPTVPVDATSSEATLGECKVHEDVAGEKRIVAGFVAGTTAHDGFQAAFDRRVLGPDVRTYCPQAFVSHLDGMDAVCGGKLHAYFGDIDIISAYEREINARPGRTCRLTYTRTFLIYEPYALLIGRGTDGFRPKFVRELYRLFSDGTVSDSYARYFSDRRPSAALSMLFRINGVPMGRLPGGAALDAHEDDPALGDEAPEPGREPEVLTPGAQISSPGPRSAFR
jgi:ABC-type amino acid transport substrate-binding protein